MHAGLRRRIGRGRRRADRLQRPHRTGLHNSAALAACLHGLRGGLRGEERVLEDVVEKTIVLSLGHLEERLRPEDARIVEQHVEPAEPVDRRLHQGLADRRKGDVADIPDGTLARGIDLMGGRFGFGGVATIDDDRAPSATNRRATSLPIPEAPPVTMAILSWKRIAVLHNCYLYLSID